jgi:acylphosphatase
MVRKHYLVTGRVQGVGFRNFVYKQARGLGVRGQVRNLVDGRVEILAQGDVNAMKAFDVAVARGPMIANVTKLETRELRTSDVNEADKSLADTLASTRDFTIVEDGEAPWPNKS